MPDAPVPELGKLGEYAAGISTLAQICCAHLENCSTYLRGLSAPSDVFRDLALNLPEARQSLQFLSETSFRSLFPASSLSSAGDSARDQFHQACGKVVLFLTVFRQGFNFHEDDGVSMKHYRLSLFELTLGQLCQRLLLVQRLLRQLPAV
jgi:hypothetical protein